MPRNNDHRWADHPELLTGIISLSDKLRKLDWNFDRYEVEVFRRPCDPEAVMFAAIDFCVSAVSLRDWTKRNALKRARASIASNLPTSDKDYHKLVRRSVRWQGAIEAIANANKHGRYDDAAWANGVAMPASFVPEPLQPERDQIGDGLALFGFMHKHRDVVWWDVALREAGSADATPGYVAFGDALDDWHRLLEQLGVVDRGD